MNQLTLTLGTWISRERHFLLLVVFDDLISPHLRQLGRLDTLIANPCREWIDPRRLVLRLRLGHLNFKLFVRVQVLLGLLFRVVLLGIEVNLVLLLHLVILRGLGLTVATYETEVEFLVLVAVVA